MIRRITRHGNEKNKYMKTVNSEREHLFTEILIRFDM